MQSTAEAKHAVVMAILTSIAASDMTARDRYWKLLACVDAMLFSRPPRFRGGKKGQGAASLNRLLSGRLRSFWSGDWMQLCLEVETNATKTDKKPVVDSITSEATMHKVLLAQVPAAVAEAQLPPNPWSVKPCQAGRWAGGVGVKRGGSTPHSC